MSVWDNPHYRSEPLIVVTKYMCKNHLDSASVLDLANFDISPYGHFHVPAPTGNFRHNVMFGDAKLTDLAYLAGKEANNAFSSRFRGFKTVKCGLDAVYTLFRSFYRHDLVLKSSLRREEADEFILSTGKVMGPASFATPQAWNKFFKGRMSEFEAEPNEDPFRFFQQAEALRHVLVAQNAASARADVTKAKLRKLPLYALDWRLVADSKKFEWNVYRYRAVTIFEHKKTRVAHVLLGKDVNRLAQMLDSTGKTFLYFHNYTDRQERIGLAGRLTAAAHEIFTMLNSAFEADTKAQMNSICRSMDIGQYIYLADKAGPLSERSRMEQQKKGFDGHYDRVFPLEEFVSLIRKFRPREALELCSIRKLLPVPDFCIYGTQYASWTQHMNPHKCIPHPDDTVTYDDFLMYWDWSMLRNFFERHKRMPGVIKPGVKPQSWHIQYPQVKPSEVPYTQVGDIDWEGTFAWNDYEYAQQDLVKDKVCAPREVDPKLTSAELDEYPLWQRNHVAKFLMDDTGEGPAAIRALIDRDAETWDWACLIALKPETKKEGGRPYYMASSPARTSMSELEANVSDYLTVKPGNSAGVADTDLLRRMQEISAPTTDLGRSIKISFDLEKWSPRQNPQLKVDMYAKWAHAFGKSHIPKLLRAQKGGRLIWIKHNVHHEYVNPGQDLEGFDAKKNTAMHIDIMGYAISVCRRKNLCSSGAKLLALIDDGGASLEFSAGTTDAQIQKCIDCIEQVYNMVGLRISWDKTFVSEELFQYLNEVYYRGFKVTPGLKAYLRIGKPTDVPAKTIVDDLDAIAGTSQGAIKAGAPFLSTYCAYLFEVYKTIKSWSHYKVALTGQHAVMCILPVAFGGIGIRSLPQLCTNEAFNPIVAALGNLKSFVHTYPSNRDAVNSILSQPMRMMNADQFLRAPKAIRSAIPTLNTQRFEIAMAAWIRHNVANPYIKSVLDNIDDMSSAVAAARVSQSVELSAVGLDLLSRMRPEAAVKQLVGKLERSDTAVKLLGSRQTLRILYQNRKQANNLIRDFGTVFNRATLIY